MTKMIITVTIILTLLVGVAVAATPLSGRFTYQGQLVLDGKPVTGTVDLQFYMYDAETNGTQVSGGLQYQAVAVNKGAFTVLLDWGTGSNFDGNQRWLEIKVRNPHDATNSLAFTTLTPRQEITAVPYALNALNASGGGGGGFWTDSGTAISNTNSGFVGIGRTTPVTLQEVFGLQAPGNGFGGMYIKSDSNTGLPFYGYKTPNYTAYDYLQASDGTWTFYNGGSLYFTRAGHFGVGVSNPTSVIAANGLIESTTGGFKFPDGSIQTTAGGGGSGSSEAITLVDSGGNQTVELWASTTGAGTADGPILRMDNTAGTRTVSLFGGKTGGGGLDMYDANGTRTMYLDTQYGTGGGGRLSLRQGDNQNGVLLAANSSVGTATDGGAIYLYDRNGNSNLVLLGDYQGTGASRVITDVVEITGGADLSENFDIASAVAAIEPGAVVCIDPDSPGALKLSETAYDRKVAGIVSGADGVRPGLVMGHRGTAADGDFPVALTGRVYCKVDASFGAIEPGDLLTTSSTTGYAMKVADHALAQGAILGKAMTALEAGQGTVLVLVSLQ